MVHGLGHPLQVKEVGRVVREEGRGGGMSWAVKVRDVGKGGWSLCLCMEVVARPVPEEMIKHGCSL
jgi:hypothetical protein